MKIHEYQGKAILREYGVAVPDGYPAFTVGEAVEVYNKLESKLAVVKAQIHAGGRGKGGGVKLAHNRDEVERLANEILGMTLVTHQTGPEGKLVRKVLVEQGIFYPGEAEPREFYMSVLLNRESGKNIIMYSTEGGMDIETVAENTPHLIHKEEVDPATGIQAFQARLERELRQDSAAGESLADLTIPKLEGQLFREGIATFI